MYIYTESDNRRFEAEIAARTEYERGYRDGLRKGMENTQRWIPVAERLPENYRKVLTCDAKGNMHINWHCETYEHPFCISEHDPRFYPVTHWMPLPDAPKEENHGKT